MEQVSSDTSNPWKRSESCTTSLYVICRSAERQHKQRRVVLWSATSVRNLNDTVHNAKAVFLDALLNVLGIVASELALRHVVSSAFRTENQEAVKTLPIADGE